jgi:hypothetical protein
MADQVYVTHCLQNDSLKNQTGFGVRAASTEDPELLKFAVEFPAYQLPMDMWANEPSPAKTPRRLALVSGPRNTLALIHSAYVGEDTMGRSGNFFTHVLFFPSSELSAIDALKSWRAADWETSYPQGARKALPKLHGPPPDGNIIGDEALTSFLSGKGAGPDQDLATLVCPSRLLNDAARCQHLLTKTIEACLAAWHADSASARNRVYLVAEPGLVALLLYGAARLLPSASAADWFFSTFENSHSSLRHFRQAFACGTYVSDPHKGLDPDYFRTLGFGLDALAANRISPELAGEASQAVTNLVHLAAEGKWDIIAQIHGCHAPGRASGESLRAAIRLHNAFIKAKNANLTAVELLEMRKSPEGESLIQKNAADFWPQVVDFAQTNEQVRREFADMIRKRAPELAAESGRLLATRDPNWIALWALVKAVEPAKERLPKHWLSLLQHAAAAAPDKPYLPSQRVVLLQECQQVYASPAAGLESAEELLAVSSAPEFEQLQKAKLPPDWLARALELGLDAAQPALWIPRVLHVASESLLEAFAARLPNAQPADDLLRKLQILVPTVEHYPIFFRLLKSGLVVPPDVVRGLLDGLQDVQRTINPTWSHGDHLETLLRSLAPFKERAEPIWVRFGRFVTKDLLFGDAGQRGLFENLTAAREQSKPSVPPRCAQIPDDWALLLALFSNPQTVTASAAEIAAVCERRKLPKPNELLKEYFAKFFQKKSIDEARIDVFAGAFDRVFPMGDADHQQLERFDSWLDIVQNLPDNKKFALQKHYLKQCVPLNVCRWLLDERKSVIVPDAYAEVSRELAQKEAAEAADAERAAPAPKRTKLEKRSGWTRHLNRGTVHLVLASMLGIVLAGVVIVVGAELGVIPLARPDLDRHIATLTDDLDDQKREVNIMTKKKTELEARFGDLQKKLDVETRKTVTSAGQASILEEARNNLLADLLKKEKELDSLRSLSAALNKQRENTDTKISGLEKKIAALEKLKPSPLSVDKLFAVSPTIKPLEAPYGTKGLRLVFYQQKAFFLVELDGNDRFLTISIVKKGPKVPGAAPSEPFLKFNLKDDEKNKKTELEIIMGKKPMEAEYERAQKALADEPELVIMRGNEIEKRFRLTP